MKTTISLMLFTAMILLSSSSMAQSDGCEKTVIAKSSPLYTARSISEKNKFDIKADKRFFIRNEKVKKSGRKQSCLINLHNEVDQDVDVFVDANYVGSIKAGTQGVVKSVSGYESVYCVSTDKMMTWTQSGDCSCVYVFKLQR